MPPPPTQAANIQGFRDSVTPDLYEASRFINWEEIEERLIRYAGAISYLQSAAQNGSLNAETFEEGLRNEAFLYEVSTALLAIPKGAIGFSDGRELPEPARRPTQRLPDIASLFIDLGFQRLIKSDVNVESLVRLALIEQDAAKRRYRVGATIKERLKAVLAKALTAANEEHNLAVEKVQEGLWPPPAKGKVEYVLAVGTRQSIAVASVFQTASGGRQQTDLSQAYPALQKDLAEYGLNLILVADGRGVREARDSVLISLFAGVASCMTFRQASEGHLLKEIVRLVATEPPSQERRALKSIIHAAISTEGVVAASSLPSDPNKASLALASYVEENPDLDLSIDPTGSSISWRKKDLIKIGTNLGETFSPNIALDFLSRILEAPRLDSGEAIEGIEHTILDVIESEGILPRKLFVAASEALPTVEMVKRVANLALTRTPETRLALLLSPRAPDDETAANLRKLQSSLTSNVIVIESNQLLRMAQVKESPLAIIARQVLEQSDLTKASPFVLNSVTPSRIFYGRETEEASMVSTLSSNSVALLGGRRIGKTSLMRHVAARLQNAGFSIYFGDCQTVRDWDDFAKMAGRLWGMEAGHPFKPAHLFDLIKQLKTTPDTKIIFLLDEIDQLLDWDKTHSEDHVSEAFFKACRSVSQHGEAQFVFSGERTIASRLWDAQSPHWNFCQPLMLRQLDEDAAHQLLVKPLRSMQITFEDESTFSSIAWNRTNGHPQLLQTLGDRVVRKLNEKAPSARMSISSSDLTEVSDTYSYAEHYLETYWGQATVLERILTLLVATGRETLEKCRGFLESNGIPHSDESIRASLRMIELYGISDPRESGYHLKLEWFLPAIAFYGTPDTLIKQYITTFNE